MPYKGDVRIYTGAGDYICEITPYGRKTSIKKTEKVREQRSVNGTLKQDVSYEKIDVTFSYDKIKELNYNYIVGARSSYLSSRQPLELRFFTNDTTYSSLYVVPRPAGYSRYIFGWYKGVTFTFIEV